MVYLNELLSIVKRFDVIVFDLAPTQIQNNGGREYTLRIFYTLIEKHPPQDILCFYYKNKPVTKEILSVCKSHSIALIGIKNYKDIQKLLDDERCRCFYSPMANGFFLSYYKLKFPKRVNVIFTVHGLGEIEIEPSFRAFKYPADIKKLFKLFFSVCFKKIVFKLRIKQHLSLLCLLSRNNGTLVVPSRHTQYSIKVFFPSVKTKTMLLYSPLKIYNPAPAFTPFGLSYKKFFLILNAEKWHKNALSAIKAFDQLFSSGQLNGYVVLVLGDASGFMKSVKNRNCFQFHSCVSTEFLEALYRDAFALVFPTMHEGFGYPPLEAIKYGTMVLASAICSIPEIYENSLIYFNPYNIDEIKNRILASCDVNYEEQAIVGKRQFSKVSEIQEKNLIELVNIIRGH